MHRVLKRQLKKAGYCSTDLKDKKFYKFISMVDRVYKDSDEDREFLEHVLETSSKEMQELYRILEANSKRELSRQKEKMKIMALQDALTGISNKFALEKELKNLISFYKNFDKKFALLFLDLDNFKNVNDTYGHDFGDKLLIEVAKRVKKNLRQEDIFARLGGDEFLIVLTDVVEDKVNMILEKLITLFHQEWIVDDITLNISTSIGIVLYPKDGNNEIELLKHADMALHRAKEIGRDNFSFFTKKLDEDMRYRMRLEADMPKALKNGEFELYYQPKIDLINDKLDGAEALIRWNHPEFGLLNPNDFITLAEINGFIVELGEWVIQESLDAIRRFNKLDKEKQLHLSMNVSAKQLLSHDIYKFMRDLMYDIREKQAVLEITETIMMEDIKYIYFILEKLHSLGVLISMDDFGTGYSSLSYLMNLPVDSLKIDKSFVDQIRLDNNEKNLINVILSMAKTLNIPVIAEGVEKEYQIDYLKKHGCEYYQGYFYSKPVNEREYMRIIEKEIYR